MLPYNILEDHNHILQCGHLPHVMCQTASSLVQAGTRATVRISSFCLDSLLKLLIYIFVRSLGMTHTTSATFLSL